MRDVTHVLIRPRRNHMTSTHVVALSDCGVLRPDVLLNAHNRRRNRLLFRVFASLTCSKYGKKRSTTTTAMATIFLCVSQMHGVGEWQM